MVEQSTRELFAEMRKAGIQDSDSLEAAWAVKSLIGMGDSRDEAITTIAESLKEFHAQP